MCAPLGLCVALNWLCGALCSFEIAVCVCGASCLHTLASMHGVLPVCSYKRVIFQLRLRSRAFYCKPVQEDEAEGLPVDKDGGVFISWRDDASAAFGQACRVARW